MFGIDGKVNQPATQKTHFDSCAPKLQNISCKLFHRATFVL